ncbi:inorganic phosphate transporter [Nocardioides rubriscoriae]|uniref:inorganic phosphate transporter n=1 Tax=Nocardioides rubriscoriae TaxID=642762 RepID=UPI0011E006F7|nr:inorganic phosphate transporter [Nocardioides rubriscoriae]
MTLAIVVAVVVVALVFDYTNGFHDAANAIATSVSTRALTPRVALTLAAVMNFIGAFLGQKVARTVSEVIEFPASMLDTEPVHALIVVLAGLLGAIAWNVATWFYGLPSSSTHALIGGLGGAALAAGVSVRWDTVMDKVVIPMLVSPLVASAAAFAAMVALLWAFRRAHPARADRGFRVAQTVSAAAMALGHGLQDAQKTMGVIFLALVVGGYQTPVSEGGSLPVWVIVAAAAAISLGTFSGGWRIMRTLGRRIIDLDPPRAFAAESVAASVLYTTAYVYQAPISTTHTITSAVIGVGATKRLSAVRWGVVRSILVAWVLTFPMAGLVAWLSYELLTVVVPT